MKPELSKDFKKKFWVKFDQEFGPSPSALRSLLIPSVTTCLLILFFVIKSSSNQSFDPVAVQIALEVDESLTTMLDTPSFSEDVDSWFDPEQVI